MGQNLGYNRNDGCRANLVTIGNDGYRANLGYKGMMDIGHTWLQ